MSATTQLPGNERIEELLADRAVFGLGEQETLELEGLCRGAGSAEFLSGYDYAAGSLSVALLQPADMLALPSGLRAKLESSAPPARSGSVAGFIGPATADRASPPIRSRNSTLAWFAAAAGIALAAISWLRPVGIGAQPRTDIRAAISSQSDRMTLPWGDWDNPEVTGVRGEVVWSERAQAGYMTFRGLPALDPTREQYQLWIIDSRGMTQRVSGGIFEGCANGECVVPITPGIAVQGAAAFAVTIEKPGGTWVSDMTRRVVIAAKKG